MITMVKKYLDKVLLILVLGLYLPVSAVNATPVSFAPLVKKTLPAVVRIRVETEFSSTRNLLREVDIPKGFEEYFDNFLDNTNPNLKKGTGRMQGSGFIFTKKGHILTNNHVVSQAKKIDVILENGDRYAAKIIGVDALTDLAVLQLLKVKKKLPVLKLGDSDKTEIGDWVIAAGSPLNIGTTVTKGIISARGRNIQTGLYDDYLQTDAPINHGNSGGPLINMKGEVIGINTLIVSSTGANIGLGFAIPSRIVKNISDQLLKYGVVRRGWLGVGGKLVTQDIVDKLKLKEMRGYVLTSIEKGSPAYKGGMKPGDVIIEFNGRKLTQKVRLPSLVAQAYVGKKLKVKVIRGGKVVTLSVKLVERKDEFAVLDGSSSMVEEAVLKGTGIYVSNLTDDFRTQYNIAPDLKGVIVVDIKKDSSAFGFVPKAGIIESINNIPISNIKEAENVVKLANKQGKKNVFLVVTALNRTKMFITISLKKQLGLKN